MMELQIFQNAEFGSVRTATIDGEPYFVGKDVAEVLGYSNPQKALRDHVDDEDKTLNESFTVNGTMGVLINESGLYSLIGDEEYDSFLYWSTSGTQSEIKRMICVNSVSGKILTMEPLEMMESFKLKSLLFDANLIKDYDAYFETKEKYEMFYSSFCTDGKPISNSLNAYELLVLLTGERFIVDILSNIAGNFIEKICGR